MKHGSCPSLRVKHDTNYETAQIKPSFQFLKSASVRMSLMYTV